MKRNAIVLLSVVLLADAMTANIALAQISPRRTPLGTQRPMPPKSTPKPEVKTPPPPAPPKPAAPREAPATTIQRAKSAHGNGPAEGIKDSIAEGRITYFRGAGPQSHQVTFDMILLRKGETQVQRTVKQPAGEVRQGSNGSLTWNSFGGAAPAAVGASLNFVESQTSRSVGNLLDYDLSGSVLREADAQSNARVVEMLDRANRKTRYSIDNATSAITRMEFEIGEARDMLSGKSMPVVEAYEFSDFRSIQGVLTPFKIERYVQGTKVEAMQFTNVRYNASIPDSAFRP